MMGSQENDQTELRIDRTRKDWKKTSDLGEFVPMTASVSVLG